MPHYRAVARAIHTHVVPAGAFRGFGVPQTAIAQEQIYDELALRIGMDRLEFRILNALEASQPTVTGQVLGEGVGIGACLEALKSHWNRALDEARRCNKDAPPHMRRGVGVAAMWYGCGNTSLPNPSTIRAGLKRDGRIALHQGAVDIGQGSNTVITQIFADALGVPIGRIDLISADTALTPDCGKTSASRQTFVTGKAAELAGRKLREEILRLANAGEAASFTLHDGGVSVDDGVMSHRIDLAKLSLDLHGRGLDLIRISNIDKYDQRFAAELFDFLACGFQAIAAACKQGDPCATPCKLSSRRAPHSSRRTGDHYRCQTIHPSALISTARILGQARPLVDFCKM